MRKLLFALAAFLALASPAKAADSAVAAMTAASALGGSELFYCSQGGADRKCTATQLGAFNYGLMSGDATASGVGAVTFATVNGNVGSFGSTTSCVSLTVNAKGLVTAASAATCAPAVGSVTGLGTGVGTFLATPSSANLLAALTTKTGTGSAVFGTSPTFTTGVTLGFVTGVADNCLHADTSGVVSGTGAGCGGGGGSGTVTSVATSCGATGGTITTTGTISAALTVNSQTGANYTIVTADCGKMLNLSNGSNQVPTIAQAGTTGFETGKFWPICNQGAGTQTITPTTSTIGGAATYVLPAATAAAPACVTVVSDGTNYQVAPDITVNAGYLTAGTLPSARIGALGTPSSGTLTNATGLPISTGVSGLGTGVATAAAANLSAAGGLASVIASGTSALGTSAIASGACASAVTTSAPNTATTDVIVANFNADPSAVTGYAPTANGMLTILGPYPTSGNVNFKVCNNTSSSITPGAITLNWRVVR